jgi:hypothetical protein
MATIPTAATSSTSSTAIASTTTSSTASSSGPIISLEIDETVPSSTWFIAPASSKSHTVSPVWKYFAYFDVGHHPGMKYFRICLICSKCTYNIRMPVARLPGITGQIGCPVYRHSAVSHTGTRYNTLQKRVQKPKRVACTVLLALSLEARVALQDCSRAVGSRVVVAEGTTVRTYCTESSEGGQKARNQKQTYCT